MPNRRRWINIGIGVVAVAAITAVGVAVVIVRGGGPESARPGITLEEVINRVDTDRPREAGLESPNFIAAQVGQELVPGDGVLTFPNSQARIDITLQELLRVVRTTPDTLWRLGQFQENQDAIIELDQGKIFLLDSGADGSSLPIQVVTPAGTGSPRGTWMSVAYNPVTEIVEVECFRGACRLENRLGSRLLTDQQKSKAPGLLPTSPCSWTPSK